jgi:hypothetical protein
MNLTYTFLIIRALRKTLPEPQLCTKATETLHKKIPLQGHLPRNYLFNLGPKPFLFFILTVKDRCFKISSVILFVFDLQTSPGLHLLK